MLLIFTDLLSRKIYLELSANVLSEFVHESSVSS